MGTALVTGANRGIGHEVARELAKEGYRVLLGVRNLETAPSFPRAEPEQLDVSSKESLQALAARLAERKERLDVLVNNAGIYRGPSREVWSVNVRGPLLLTRALAPLLQRGGRVVNVTSGLGALDSQDASLRARLSDPKLTLDGIARLCDEAPDGYGASKATLNALTRLLAEELAEQGVLVNATCPGWVRTDMGGPGAPRSVEEGAASVLFACRLPANGPTGKVFRDGAEIPP